MHRVLFILAGMMLFAACATEPTPTATPKPTATPEPPTATATPEPTATPTPVPTATPTATPQPTPTPRCREFPDAKSAWDGGNPTCAAYPYPTPTPTPRPTSTPTPRPTPTPAPTPTPTQTPISDLGLRSFDFMQKLTGSTFLTDDEDYHTGYIGWNERNETFNAFYFVPVSDEPECVVIYMGSTLPAGHYARTIDRVLVLMGFYPDVVEEFTARFVAAAQKTPEFKAVYQFFGWSVGSWSDERYNRVFITRDEMLRCAPVEQSTNVKGSYSLPLAEGWNLISFPGAPSEADIYDVLPAESWWVDLVLSYQQGEWRTAVRDETGLWRGENPPDFGAGHGYWLHAFQSGTLETMLLPVGDIRPSLSNHATLSAGWNLIGVIDRELLSHGQSHSAGLTLDEYLSGSPWGVAFAYATTRAEWQRFNPGGDEPIRNGWGYWLWAGTEPPPDEPPSF